MTGDKPRDTGPREGRALPPGSRGLWDRDLADVG